MRKPTNAEIARSLREIALYLEMDEVPFKPQAYEKASYAIASLNRPVSQIFDSGGVKAIQDIRGIGKGIAQRIAELLREGTSKDLEAYRRKVPADILGLTALAGLGPRRVKTLYDHIDTRTIDELEAAIREGKVHGVPGFGAISERRLLESIAAWRRHSARWPMSKVIDLARTIERRLRAAPRVESASLAGSARRLKTTVGDLDFLVVTSQPNEVMRLFANMPEVERVYARGPTKTSVRLSQGIDVDLRAVPRESYGAALQYFTGSKAHNVALRRIAISMGLKLSEYGLFRDEELVAGRTEEDVYRALGLVVIPPELREDEGEIEAAAGGALPRLVEAADLRGDLQMHTSWTDGRDTIEEMALFARELGLEYICITDHTRDLAMTGGLDEDDLRRQSRLIRAIDRRIKGIRVLAGAEVNIRRDGSLDISDDALATLDLVGAAVHSHFNLSRQEATRRVIRAAKNPNVDVIFHLTARQLGRREPIDLDIEAVVRACKRTGTILEIDAQPDRLDLSPGHVRRAVAHGVGLTIDSDAHDMSELRFPRDYGIGLARRGWAEPKDVLNTRPLRRLLAALKPKEPGREKRSHANVT